MFTQGINGGLSSETNGHEGRRQLTLNWEKGDVLEISTCMYANSKGRLRLHRWAHLRCNLSPRPTTELPVTLDKCSMTNLISSPAQ